MKELLAVVFAALGTYSSVADAAVSFRSSPSRSFSSSRVTAPRPATPPRPVIVQRNTTVVQRNTVVQQAAPAGGGFLSTVAGSFAGAGLAHWLLGGNSTPDPVDCNNNPQHKDCVQGAGK